ncbi:MAG TPA: NACHT domain-containing protein, partial [Pyrinomonadaceae bacterium]|nr:NACHT domain-containing protein [Pyrinomonadaceae bacterium]
MFGKEAEAAGLTMQDVVTAYDQAYLATKQNKPWWRSFLPNAGWIVAIVFFFLLILQETFRKAVGELAEKLLRRIYRRTAGYKIFQKKALRNYKKALVKKYQHFKIPFRAERDLDMGKIYIPIKIKGSDNSELINDSDIIDRFKRVVVTGAPGSGKSMLLKRLALSYALKPVQPQEKTPVLIDLRRFNEGEQSLVDHLIATLAVNDFPNAANYIDASLNDGTLLLLFDGLDEVANLRQGTGPTRRECVVREIIDLLDEHEDCPAIITCRTAVYRRDFDDIAERTLEIVEFSDQQIQNFLMSWPEPPANKPIEQLITSLSERPAILALARNPLLLTIVAFLYT